MGSFEPVTGEGACAGIRVLDLSRLLPGPYCSLLLADMGAEVLKIEEPRGGDWLRWMPPMTGSMSRIFAAINRGKKSVALDLKTAEGVAAFRALVATADVVLESFRPGVMDRLGIGASTLLEWNPRLIYCAISGYGQTGTHAHRAGHDINYLALSGLLAHNGAAGADPVVPGFQAADIAGGSYVGAMRICAALFERERTGKGGMLDVSLTRGAAGLAAVSALESLANGVEEPRGEGLLAGSRACYRVYSTQDGGHMALGALEPVFWARFCEAVERPDWLSRQMEVGEVAKEFIAEVSALFKTRTRAEWEALFAPIDACCEPVLSLLESLDHPAVTGGTSLRFEVEDAEGNPFEQLRTPVLDPERTSGVTPAPALGEHTELVLSTLALTPGESPEDV
jgi:crotonobetainyl-CoA:carnitine CoA-transferase CaiB-like acyl-CoA transferase